MTKVFKITESTNAVFNQMNIIVKSATTDTRQDSKEAIQAIFSALSFQLDDGQYKAINDYRIASVKRINKL